MEELINLDIGNHQCGLFIIGIVTIDHWYMLHSESQMERSNKWETTSEVEGGGMGHSDPPQRFPAKKKQVRNQMLVKKNRKCRHFLKNTISPFKLVILSDAPSPVKK